MDRTRHNKAVYRQPAFLICTVVLAAAGAGMSVATKKLGVYLQKEPLPLKKPLSALDEQKLTPYKVVTKLTIENKDILQSLGTEDYIQWVLEDPCEPVTGATRNVLLFVTYYEVPDRVPHVPEECYTGGGYEWLSSESIAFQIRDADRERTVPGRVVFFRTPAGDLSQRSEQFPVLYLFRVNGQYEGDRKDARMALNRNIFSKYSYFSKIELAFSQAYIAPSGEDAAAAGERLLSVLLPILEQDHWPDEG